MEGYPIHEQIMRGAATELYADEPMLHTRIHAPAPYTGKDKWYDFKIQLNWVQFIEHALFTKEDKLCRELEDLCAEYKRRETINLLTHYESKLKGLRAMLQQQVNEYAAWERKQVLMRPADGSMTPSERQQRLVWQQKQLDTLLLIREAVDMRDREEHEQRTLFKHIYAKWMDIRVTRSEVTKEMKAKGFWQTELQPVPAGKSQPVSPANQTGVQQPLPSPLPSPSGIASPSVAVPGASPVAVASPTGAPDQAAVLASYPPVASPDASGVASPIAQQQPQPPPPLDVSSPMASQPASNDAAAAAQASARLAAAQEQPVAFSPPPPPPPPPPEMPAPALEPQQPVQLHLQPQQAQQPPPVPSYDPQAYAAAQQAQQQAYMQQQQAAWAGMTKEQQAAYMQQQEIAQAYQQQQQQLAYQQYYQQMQQQQGLKPEEESKEQAQPIQQQQPQLPISSPQAVQPKKGHHVTLTETLAQERDRLAKEQLRLEQERLDASRTPGLTVNTASTPMHVGASTFGEDALSTRMRGDLLGFGDERRAGLLKETYIGYPSNFKVGRHQLDWKHKAEDTAVYRQEKAAWLDAIKAEVRETKLRLKLERCLANGGVDPDTAQPLMQEQEHARDQELFDAIERRMSTMRRRPGGTKYLPVYNEDVRVFDTSRCLLEEQVRRRLIEGYRVFLRVFVNGMRVCDTAPALLSFPKFKATFDQSIPLHLVSMPSSITVQIFHATGLLASDEPLAELGLPVPEFGAPASIQQYSFAGVHIDPETAVMKHVATAKDPFGPSRYTAGLLEACVSWGKDSVSTTGGQGREAPEHATKILQQFIANDRPRVAMRNKVLAGVMSLNAKSKRTLDPNDPRNAEMLEYMHRSSLAAGAAGRKKSQFLATESQVEGRLVNPKYHQISARSLVLQARNESGFIRDPVPLRDEDISSQLYSYIRVRDETEESEWEKSKQNMKQIDTELLYEREQMRAQAKILNVSHEVHDIAEVVNELELPVLSVDMAWLNKLFEKRRDLRPKRDVHKAVSAPKSCNIVIQVVKGQNMPVRKVDGTTGGSQTTARKNQAGNVSSMPLEQQENVRTFVEISLQDTCKRTTCSRGTNPRWDQLISLQFRPPAQSFSPAHLSTCTDMISFNVFDEITTSNEIDPRLTRTRVHHSEQRWLGSFSIPFTTIYNNGKIDGAFSINVPPHLLGYEQPHSEREAFLFIYATMDPVLATPPPKPDRFHHMNPFYARAIQWCAELKAKSPMMAKRSFLAVAGDISSNPQFICRYITAERPPDKYQHPNIFTRFVSIIPFQEDAQASLGTVKDIWCTSKDFLALQGGDWEEHAILLNNYFTWYDTNMADVGSRHQNYVVLGQGSVWTTTSSFTCVHAICADCMAYV
jgi:hypothetical protein